MFQVKHKVKSELYVMNRIQVSVCSRIGEMWCIFMLHCPHGCTTAWHLAKTVAVFLSILFFRFINMLQKGRHTIYYGRG